MSSNDIPAVVSSILKRKSNVGGYIDTSRHFMETVVNPVDGTTALSITKRSRVPPSQAVSVISQKMISTDIFHPARNEQVTDIATFQPNNDIAIVSKNKSESRKQRKNLFDDEIHVQDASYREMTEEILNEMESPKYNISKSSRKSSEAPRKASRQNDDRWITSKGSSVEPPAMRAISAQKQKTISQLAKSPQKHWGDDSLARIDSTVDKYVTDPARVVEGVAVYVGSTIKKGMRKQAKEIRDDLSYELETNRQARATKNEYYQKQKEIENGIKRANKIEKAKETGIYYAKTNALDRTVDRAKKIQKTGNKILKATTPVIVDTLKAIDNGAYALGNSTIGKNINRNAEAEYSHMRSAGRRARGSIVGGSNIENKRTRTAASLITQHGIATKTATTNTAYAGATNQYGIVGRYEYGRSGKLELHYYHNNGHNRLTHEQVSKILTAKQIQVVRQQAILGYNQVNEASTPNTNTNSGNNIGAIAKKPVQRTLNRPKTTTASGLVHRNKSGVV